MGGVGHPASVDKEDYMSKTDEAVETLIEELGNSQLPRETFDDIAQRVKVLKELDS
jgi:hypothetical protein